MRDERLEGEIARAVADAVQWRRRLHRIPEIGLELPRTSALVRETLGELGVPAVAGDGIGSVVGVVRGDRPGPTVLLRADLDALPIQERTGLEFASEHPGAMHACGHDLHTAGLLGAAAMLARRTELLAGSVVLMFQPGEEGWFGARTMIEAGVLETPAPGIAPPSTAFALHVNPWYPLGSVNLRAGAILAAADTFEIIITGRAGHGSAPHAAADPIPAAAELVSALQAMVARTTPPFDPAVVSVTGLQAGSAEARSAIPATAALTGTIRTLSAERREEVTGGLTRLAQGIASGHGLEAEVRIERGYPATVNDAAVVRRATAVLEQRMPSGVRELPAPLMGSEDFSYVLERIPGALAFIGTTPAEELEGGWPADNHSATVRYDERALDAFVRAHLAFVESELGGDDA